MFVADRKSTTSCFMSTGPAWHETMDRLAVKRWPSLREICKQPCLNLITPGDTRNTWGNVDDRSLVPAMKSKQPDELRHTHSVAPCRCHHQPGAGALHDEAQVLDAVGIDSLFVNRCLCGSGRDESAQRTPLGPFGAVQDAVYVRKYDQDGRFSKARVTRPTRFGYCAFRATH